MCGTKLLVRLRMEPSNMLGGELGGVASLKLVGMQNGICNTLNLNM